MSQPKPKIGIVMSTTRQARFGEKPARWIHKLASRRADLDFELIDLRTSLRSSRPNPKEIAMNKLCVLSLAYCWLQRRAQPRTSTVPRRWTASRSRPTTACRPNDV